MPNSPNGLAGRIGLAAVLICLALPLPARAAQEETASPEADSIALLEEAKQVQKEFERFREQRLPSGMERFREASAMLWWAGCACGHGDGEAPPVEPAPLEVEMARMDMLRTLGRIHSSIPRDRWVLGQRVYYLREQGELLRAEALTERCHPDDEWWCMALKGYLPAVAGREHRGGSRLPRRHPADARGGAGEMAGARLSPGRGGPRALR